jgi:coenzyme F420-0:L-glutamate ligase/coenzyme F420-1:gamma-L-glutamate ligase
MPSPALSIHAIPGLPRIELGADLAATIAHAVQEAGLEPADDDIFAVAQKIISKAEGRTVNLSRVTPSPESIELAKQTDKDPRMVELILNESKRVVRHGHGVIIVEHRLGIVLANAGIDRSNVEGGEDTVLLLPEDPDASAEHLRHALEARFGVRLGVIVTDSVGRPWRLGTTGIAIGCAGLKALNDLRGQRDMSNRVLQVAEVATADCLAGAASLVMGEGAEAVPVVLIKGGLAGQSADDGKQNAKTILRPVHEDLFR